MAARLRSGRLSVPAIRSVLSVFTLLLTLALLAGCSEESFDNTMRATRSSALNSGAALGTRLRMAAERMPTAAGLRGVNPHGQFALVAHGSDVSADVIFKLDRAFAHRAASNLRALGVNVRTVTRNGYATGTMPLGLVYRAAAVDGVERITLASRVHPMNDVSQGPTGMNFPTGGADDPTGAGVIVGVIDTGIDFTHPDFIDAFGNTRVLHLWDQSDYSDSNPPAGMGYGTVYDQADLQDCLDGVATCDTTDTDGHGTHVAGTAAASGAAFTGGAPDANLVIVRFDFDGDRNSTASIVDGVNWIFQMADAAGMPAVINMSLGTDYGPHDGTTLEERSITDLTGAGKIVVVAAGNAARSGDAENLALWGYPIHGEGAAPDGACSDIYIDVPSFDDAGEDYVFFDIWYSGDDQVRVQVETPGNNLYPPTFTRNYRSTWTTGSSFTGFNTSEGAILVANGGDQLGWEDNNADHELYIEISDYWGTPPATGTWRVCIYGDKVRSGPAAAYHGWHGTSSSLTTAPVAYQDPGDDEPRPTDNRYTVGSPASADGVIAVAASTSRMGWGFWNPLTDTYGCQTYNEGPLSYYDAYYVDADGDGVYDYNYGGDCYFDAGDTSEAFDTLAYFSSRGPLRSDPTGVVSKPEIATPGVGIISSFSSTVLNDEIANGGGYFVDTNRIHEDGLHAVLQGTSMACPNATGAVANLLEINPALTPDDVRDLLISTARSGADTGSVPNEDWGYGRLDLSNAVAALTASMSCSVDADCDDSNPCTVDTCTDSVCYNTYAGDDATCGGGDICCAGDCGAPACATDADCGTADACSTPICLSAGTCGAQCDIQEPACQNDDGCCPTGCDAGNDNDCVTECLPLGASCTSDSECCSDKCRGGGGNKVCR